jgi:hypothetical protein
MAKQLVNEKNVKLNEKTKNLIEEAKHNKI